MTSLLPLCLVCVIDVLGFGIMVPLLPYMADRFDATPAVITQLFAVFSLFQLLASPMWGRLSDRFGRRPILISSMAGACCSYVLLGFATSLAWLFVARIVAGAMAGNLAAAFAYASDVSAPKDRARAMGMVGAAVTIGFMIGPALGGLLAGEDEYASDFRVPALVAAALSLVAMALVWWRLPESRSTRLAREQQPATAPRAWQLLRDRAGLRWLVVAAVLVTYAQATLESIAAIWAMDRFGAGPRTVGLALFGMGLIVILMQGLFVRRLVPLLGERRLAVAGICCFAAGMLTMGAAGSMTMTAWGLALVGIGSGAFAPTGSSLASQHAHAEERGAVMGTYQAGSSLARVLGPVAAGPIYAGIGHNAPFLVAGVVVLQAAWCVLGERRHQRSGEPR